MVHPFRSVCPEAGTASGIPSHLFRGGNLSDFVAPLLASPGLANQQ